MDEATERAYVARQRGEIRKRAQREVDLRHGSRRSIAADAREKARLELHRIDQSEQRSPGIGVRHDRLRLQLFA